MLGSCFVFYFLLFVWALIRVDVDMFVVVFVEGSEFITNFTVITIIILIIIFVVYHHHPLPVCSVGDPGAHDPGSRRGVGGDPADGPRRRRPHPGHAHARRKQAPLALGRDARRHTGGNHPQRGHTLLHSRSVLRLFFFFQCIHRAGNFLVSGKKRILKNCFSGAKYERFAGENGKGSVEALFFFYS